MAVRTAVKAPDGGYGWLIVFSCFLIYVIHGAIIFCFGLYIDEFVQYFDASHGSASLLGSLMLGVEWASGPFAGALTNMYGCRKVAVAGGIIASFGYFISIFAPNIIFMCLSYGAITGFGLALNYIPSVVIICQYFEKKRSLAMGIAVSGIGVGTFVFGALTEYMLEYYGTWRSAVLIQTGLLLNCIPLSALFRSINSNKSTRDSKVDSKVRENDTDQMRTISKRHNAFLTVKNQSTYSLPCHVLSNGQVYEQNKTPSNDMYNSDSELANKTVSKCVSMYALYGLDYMSISQSVDLNNKQQEMEEPQDSRKNRTCTERLLALMPCVNMDWKEEICSCSLLKQFFFIWHCFSGFLLSMAICVPFAFISDRATVNGQSPKQGAMLVSVIGITSTISRLLFGLIADHPKINRLFLYGSLNLICGLCTMISSLCLTYPLMMLYAITFGALYGGSVPLSYVVLVDLMGVDKIASAFGIYLAFQGLGAIVGPPIAGCLYDVTKTYDLSFHVMGAMMAFGGGMLYFIPLMRRSQHKSADNRQHADNRQAIT